jgi:oxalate decarboxylase/phosphoglucose isomerase-like protein (cupin superfamily)
MRVGADTMEVAPGSFVRVPPGVVHTFSNRSDAPDRFLNLNTPSGWENYMRDLARELPRDRAPAPEEIGRIASRYDFHRPPDTRNVSNSSSPGVNNYC